MRSLQVPPSEDGQGAASLPAPTPKAVSRRGMSSRAAGGGRVRRSMTAVLACGLLLELLASTAPAPASAATLPSPPSTTWVQQSPTTSPAGRTDASVASDLATGSVVLFGGVDSSQFPAVGLSDTWTWSQGQWTKQVTTSGPSARFGATMTYDASNGTVVLFGGGIPGVWCGAWPQ